MACTESNDYNIVDKEDGSPPGPLANSLVRIETYQTESDFVVDVMAKNLNTDDVFVEFNPTMIAITAKMDDGSVYSNEMTCYRKISPERCSFKVLSTKVEIRLRKLNGGFWPCLEAVTILPNDFKPCYPSSSAKQKNWDLVEREIKHEEENNAEDDINSVFSKMYESGDENMKRAMIKSMQESNGTVLSTSWDEVRKKTVEVTPPDGVVFRKWDD